MRLFNRFLIISSIFILVYSCKKDQDADINSLCHTWEAKRFMSIESVAYPKNENTPILLTFKKDGTYALKLDINSCG